METLLGLSVAMAAGLLMSRLAKVLRLPAVTAYLVAGILIGPYLLGSLGIPGFGYDSMDELGALDVILDGALGFIAFQMGDEFRMEDLRQIGAKCTVIAVIRRKGIHAFREVSFFYPLFDFLSCEDGRIVYKRSCSVIGS